MNLSGDNAGRWTIGPSKEAAIAEGAALDGIYGRSFQRLSLTDHAMLTRTRLPPVVKGGVAADVINQPTELQVETFVSLASVHDRYPVACTPECVRHLGTTGPITASRQERQIVQS